MAKASSVAAKTTTKSKQQAQTKSAKEKGGEKTKATKATIKTTTKSATIKPTKATKTTTPETYADVRKMLDKPLSEVQALPIGRNGEKVIPRRFHLLQDDLDKLSTEYKETKRIPNPHNKGAYFYFIESLIILGKDKAHQFKAIKEQMRKLMSDPTTKDENDKTDWQRFNGKESHADNEENAKDIDGKLHQNAYVLQRLGGMTPYGLKLLQVGQMILKTKGMVVDCLKGKDGKEKLYRLNTNASTPMNEFVKRRS